jgi:predicted nucleotidyltransferase
MTYMARDFLETDEGLYFAVVENGLEDGVVLSSLRYVTAGGRPRKLSPREAKAFLSARHPEYLFRSVRRDVELHGVPEPRVRRRHDPRVRAARVRESAADLLEARARLALSMLEEAGVPPTSVGLTGSLLIRAHSEHSDIDLVIYDRSAFERARDFVGSLPAEAGMSDALWREAYRRRGCALSFSEYVRHESRKHNKLVVEGAKVDLGLVLARFSSKMHPTQVEPCMLAL